MQDQQYSCGNGGTFRDEAGDGAPFIHTAAGGRKAGGRKIVRKKMPL